MTLKAFDSKDANTEYVQHVSKNGEPPKEGFDLPFPFPKSQLKEGYPQIRQP